MNLMWDSCYPIFELTFSFINDSQWLAFTQFLVFPLMSRWPFLCPWTEEFEPFENSRPFSGKKDGTSFFCLGKDGPALITWVTASNTLLVLISIINGVPVLIVFVSRLFLNQHAHLTFQVYPWSLRTGSKIMEELIVVNFMLWSYHLVIEILSLISGEIGLLVMVSLSFC